MLLMVSRQNYNELPHSRSAVPVDTIQLHSVIELDRTGVTYLEMYSAGWGQQQQVDVQHFADIKLNHLTCHSKYCYHGLKMCFKCNSDVTTTQPWCYQKSLKILPTSTVTMAYTCQQVYITDVD